MSRRSLSRRRALALLGLGTASVAVGAAGLATSLGRAAGRLRPETGQPLREAAVVDSRDGVLQVGLTAAAGVRLAGHDTSALGFNGTSPGPTLRLQPGDQLRVRLTNRLGEPTNLHTHGLHVSPLGAGDNQFVRIDPGASFDYTIRVPRDHPPGTFWYHPHHHGVVANQIFGGLVGALLVEGGVRLPVAADRVLLVTDISLDAGGDVVAPDRMAQMMGREGDLVLVNGQHQPVIAAAPGAVQRWRLINGCVSRVLAVRLGGHRLAHIAVDGRYLPAPVARDRVVLAPGNRADLLITPGGTGRYGLVAEPYDRGTTAMMGRMGMASSAPTGPVPLATVDVSGAAHAPMPIPGALPAPPVPAGEVVRRRQITFAVGMGGMGMGGMGGMSFTIDGRTFDPARDDQTTQLGTVEEWTVFNTSPMDHPFHLHNWPFQVTAGSSGTPLVGIRQDVVLVPARGWVRLRIPFVDYAGRSVYHCHILDHEDRGMMATINVRG